MKRRGYEMGYSSSRGVCMMLNKRMLDCKTADAVLAVVAQHGYEFDIVCMATALHQLAHLKRGGQRYCAYVTASPVFHLLMGLIAQNVHHFSGRNIANTMWALAKLERKPEHAVFHAMLYEAARRVEEFNAQNTANTMWAFATLGYNKEEVGEYLLDALSRRGGSIAATFTAQNLSNILLALAKMEHHPPRDVIDIYLQEVTKKLSDFNAQALSNTLWALGKMDLLSVEEDAVRVLVESIAQHCMQLVATFNSQNIANTVWACAKAGYTPSNGLLDQIVDTASHRMGEFSAQNLSNTVWGMAKLNMVSKEFLCTRVPPHVTSIAHTFGPQAIANLLWGYASLAVSPPPPMLQALVGRSVLLLSSFSPQNMANTLWALATINHKNEDLCHAVCYELCARLPTPNGVTFSRQHLSNILWAWATLEYKADGTTLTYACFGLVERIADCNPQEMSNATWAIAKIGYYHRELLEVVAATAIARMSEFSAQNLANLIWSFGKLGHHDEKLMDAAAVQAANIVKELSLQHISNLMWACATLYYDNTALMAALNGEIEVRLDAQQPFNAQQLANIMWGGAILGYCRPALWRRLLECFKCVDGYPQEVQEEALTQVFQAYLIMLSRYSSDEVYCCDDVIGRAREKWVATSKRVQVSDFQRQVSAVLTRMGIVNTLEHRTADDLFSIDIVLEGEENARIAVEADGPHHYAVNNLRETGETMARRRVLEGMGWKVVSVAYYKWRGTVEEKTQLLTAALDAVREDIGPPGVPRESTPLEVAAESPPPGVPGEMPSHPGVAGESPPAGLPTESNTLTVQEDTSTAQNSV